MTYAGSLPQGQPPFLGQPQHPQAQQHHQQHHSQQQGHPGYPQAFPQQQPQQPPPPPPPPPYTFPSQQLPYDYNNLAHLQQAQAQPQPQQQQQQIHGQNQWGFYDGGYRNTGGGGMQVPGSEQYMPPANVWPHHQQQQPQQVQRHHQQNFHVPSPQMAQNMMPQAQFQRQGQVPSPQMAQLQQQQHQQASAPQRSPSMPQQLQQQQHHPRQPHPAQGQPQVQQQSHPSPSLPQQQQQQFNAQVQPPLQNQLHQQQQYQQHHRKPQMQRQSQPSPSMPHQQYAPPPQQKQPQASSPPQPRQKLQQQPQLQKLQHQPQAQPQIQGQPKPPPGPQAQTHVQTKPSRQPAPQQSSPQPQIQPKPAEQQFQPPADQQMQFVNLQDIEWMPISMPTQTQPTIVNPPSSTDSSRQASLQPAPVIKKSPSTTPGMSHVPLKKPESLKTHQSPRVPASQSPATPAGQISSKSPAVATKPSPYNAIPMMVALAEEFVSKARAAAPSVAASLQSDEVEEYQKLIGTGLGCLEAALQSQRLSPRQEARVRLRYAAVLHEETENIMEAETTLSKGITLCDKHRMLDLKYCMQYLMMKALSQRNRKAALKALDQHISDCDAYKHVHWTYAFRLLKASFYMDTGNAADATSLENIRSIQNIAATRGDSALSVYASLSEALVLLKTSRGTPEMIQSCLAQASKYQLDPQVKIPQLELMYLLVDYLSSLHREKQEAIVERLRRLQKKIDECQSLVTKADFLIPIKKHSSSTHTIGGDVSAIIRPGNDDSDSDYLVITFMTQMELMILVFTMGGLTYLHKPSPSSVKASTVDLWRQGLKILGYWENSTKTNMPALTLSQAIKQREWRADVQCYLNLLLGLLAASQCSWDAVNHHLSAAQNAKADSTMEGMLNTFFVYLRGVYCQGIGDFDNALSYYQDESLSFSIAQPKESQRHLALLAAMNRLWIMQQPSHQNEPVTMELLNELEPLCREHYNIEIRGAWSGVKATVVTNPPRQRNQRKEDAGRALGDVRTSTNALATTIGLVIARDLLYNNVLGDQAWKCMQAAAQWANKSCNPLWQSVVDGILADFSEARNEKENAKKFWDKGVQEAKLAFARSS